jgi:transcriptional regulator GlxA family with amidase domain
MFEGQKTHEDNQVLEVQNIIESNIHNKISVSDLANRTSLGKRSLERRFKKATNNTVLEYMQRIKIEAAKRSFERSNKNINEVMYDVGYSDTKAFRSVFKKITGMTPIEYRSKYYKE